MRIGNTIDKGVKTNPTIETQRGPSVKSKAQQPNGPLPPSPHRPSKASRP